MARPKNTRPKNNLSAAAKARKLARSTSSAAKTVTDKIAKGKSKPKDSLVPTAFSKPTTSNSSQPTATGNSVVTVPGLPSNLSLTPDKVAGMMPQFNVEAYAITDPLNPPENLPQVTEADFDKRMGIYEGAQRALKLVGAAFDTTGLKFTAIGKQAKAFGSGIKAATEIERVKGDYLDYLSVTETTAQKNVAYSVAQYKTTSDTNKAVHDKSSLDERLNQASIAADSARATTRDKQSKLDEFKKSLGEFTTTAKAS
jgi:hypothetical protein